MSDLDVVVEVILDINKKHIADKEKERQTRELLINYVDGHFNYIDSVLLEETKNLKEKIMSVKSWCR